MNNASHWTHHRLRTELIPLTKNSAQSYPPFRIVYFPIGFSHAERGPELIELRYLGTSTSLIVLCSYDTLGLLIGPLVVEISHQEPKTDNGPYSSILLDTKCNKSIYTRLYKIAFLS